MIRLFAAIEPPPDAAESLASRQMGVENARWRAIDSLHLTLRFFGEVREDVARDLDSELLGVGGGPFDLTIAGAGAFSDQGEPRAIWAGVEENAALSRLARACEIAARRAGLAAETRVYKPHVTLAYLRGADPREVALWVQQHNLMKSPPIRVDRFGLYSSRLTKDGAHYELEAEYIL